MSRELTACQKIEHSLQKKFRKDIWSPFVKGVKTYNMIEKDDKIAVCISGGKDSMLMAKLMQALQKISDVPFGVEFLVMNPGYNQENLQRIIDNAALLEIPINIFNSDIFDVVVNVEKSPCYLCARMRRGYLYSKAKELGCNKIALGHHFSDVVETTVMGMFYGAQYQTMMPKLKSKNFNNMQLIRPMYCVHEESIISWAKYNNLEFIRCACRFVEEYTRNDNKEGTSKRQEVKELLKTLKKDNPEVEHRIFKSVHMVNLETVLGFKYKGKEYNFLDYYDSEDDIVLTNSAVEETEII